MCLDTTIVSLFFKKKIKKKSKKKKEEGKKKKGDMHNQSINHWCLKHLSCILEELYG